MGVRQWMVGLLVAALACGAPTACSSRHATIDVGTPVALADQALHVRVSGLRARETVTVGSQATDYQGTVWHGEAMFAADDAGIVRLDRTAPTAGTYDTADGMGLFWSMRPATGDPDHSTFLPPFPELANSFEVRLTVTAGGRELAARTVTRQWMPAGVTHRTLDLGTDKVVGDLYLPPAGASRRPGVLLIGGSSGGVTGKYDAALFAAHGYPALALGYFAVPGLPKTLNDIPLEYFAAAARLLRAQPGADPAGIVAHGYSRGSEVALLLANYYPDLVRATILYAPNDAVGPGFHWGDAWTRGGVPVPQAAIPVTRVTGPVLAIAGGDDHEWPSDEQAQRIMQHLDDAHVTAAHQALRYPDAGHNVGTFPYLAQGTTLPGSIQGMGGTRAADAAARADGWPKVLDFLATVASKQPS